MRCRPTRLLPFLLLGLFLARGGRAAPDAPAEAAQRPFPFFIRATDQAKFAVPEARRLLAEGRTAQALRMVQRLIDEMPNDYFPVSRSAEAAPWSQLWVPVANEARDILTHLDADERKVYEDLSRPAAAPLLDRAIAERDPDALARLAARYGASDEGVTAIRLLTMLALREGRFPDAVYWARQGLWYAPDDAGLWFRFLDAQGLAGDRAALEKTVPPPGVVLDEETADHRRRAWLARLPKAPPLEGWPSWGGDPAHVALAPSAGPKPQHMRWRRTIPISMSQLDQDPIRGGMQDEEAHFQEAWQAFRPLHPTVADRTVYVSNGRAVSAMDLYSGALHWTFDNQSPGVLRTLMPPPNQRNMGRTSLERVFTPVVSKDLVLATVEIRHPYEPERLEGVEISTYLPRRVVVALDRADGHLRWVMQRDPQDDDPVHGLSVVSPVVVSGSLVVCVVSSYQDMHHVSLLALDRETGKKVWQRSLGWGAQELNLFGAPVKELAVPVPAIADGLVYATSGIGFVACVELRSGRPVWLASYEIQPIRAVDFWYTAPLRFPRVAPSPLVVTDDLVLAAPTDGVDLVAFDRRTGTLRWSVPYPRTMRVGAPATFLGVANDGHRDVALLTGTDLVALDLASGKTVWRGHLQDEYGTVNVPIGTGAVTDDQVLVPTDNGLVHFSLPKEGSFEGRDPWPREVESGNVLPLPQILLVTARDRLQAFYSWDEIEKDIAARRAARPDDPGILLEAGEIYRLGGALERAQRMFEEARRMSEGHADLADSLRRAEQGLYRTWLDAASKPGISGDESLADLQKGITWARTPSERVEARIRIDTLLQDSPERRVENLQHLVEEATDVRARFPGTDVDVPARAMALLKLAQVQADRGRPAEALEALQRLLADAPDAEIAGTPARTLARNKVDEILKAFGRKLYEPYEKEATRLLARAEKTSDTALLSRILLEYPNAAVVPDALLHLGEQALASGQGQVAADVLRRLLAEHPDHPNAAQAAASLARAYRLAGYDGGSRFALFWLTHHHAGEEVLVDGQRERVDAFARAEARPPRMVLPPEDVHANAPLQEVRFTPVDEEAWGRQVRVETSGGERAPAALLTDGRVLTAYDLVHGRVAFSEDGPALNRAYYEDGLLVLGFGRGLRCVSVDKGQTLWEHDVEGSVLELKGSHGQVYALVHDATGRRAVRRLVAVDVIRGKVLWRLDLGGDADFRDLEPHGGDVLLREARFQAGRVWPALLVVDALTGRLRRTVTLPQEGVTDGDPLAVGDRFLLAARDPNGTRTLMAYDLATGDTAWAQVLPGEGRACALLPDGEDAVVVLRSDGTLATYAVADGRVLGQTRIFAGENTDACSLYGTSPLLDGDHILLVPRSSTPPFHVGAWDRKTGKIVWDTPLDEPRRPQRSALQLDQGSLLLLTPFDSRQQDARVLLRVLDPDTGTERQRIEPVGLTAEYGLVSLASGWGSVVVFGRAGATLYAPRSR